jgi:hypothetical protein
VINALSYLFNRRELPPFIVHRVYKDLMDIESSRGTSSRAIQDLGYLLKNYREKRYEKFAVESKFIWGVRMRGKWRKRKLKYCRKYFFLIQDVLKPADKNIIV